MSQLSISVEIEELQMDEQHDAASALTTEELTFVAGGAPTVNSI